MQQEDSAIDEELSIMNEEQEANYSFANQILATKISSLNLRPAITLSEFATVSDAIELMKDKSSTSIIITRAGMLTGIVTHQDIFYKVTGKIMDTTLVSISEIMTPRPIALMGKDSIAYVLTNMQLGGYQHIPIVDLSNKPTHIVTVKEVLEFIVELLPEEVINLTSEPFRGESNRYSA